MGSVPKVDAASPAPGICRQAVECGRHAAVIRQLPHVLDEKQVPTDLLQSRGQGQKLQCRWNEFASRDMKQGHSLVVHLVLILTSVLQGRAAAVSVRQAVPGLGARRLLHKPRQRLSGAASTNPHFGQ